MAISDSQKLDYLYKKIGYGVAGTDNGSYKSPSNEQYASPLLVRGDNIWINSGDIPAVPPASTTSVVKVNTGAGAIKTSADLTVRTNRAWLTSTINWIGVEFGPQYQLKVYVDDASATNPAATGTRLYPDGSGNSDGWFFDYQSGILTFPDTNIPTAITAGKVIFVEGYQYVGTLGLPATVANAAALDSALNQLATLTSGAPSPLDTLQELANAIGNDPNFVTTITSDLALKANIADLATVAFSGNYYNLTNTPTLVSTFVNDANYANIAYVDTAISNLVGNAPAVLDTLKELADAIGNNPNFVANIASDLSQKVNTSDLANVATSGSYTDLSNKPVQTFEFGLSTVWTVVHNRGTRFFVESTFNSDGQKIMTPVSIIDENSFEIRLTQATAGHVTVFFG